MKFLLSFLHFGTRKPVVDIYKYLCRYTWDLIWWCYDLIPSLTLSHLCLHDYRPTCVCVWARSCVCMCVRVLVPVFITLSCNTLDSLPYRGCTLIHACALVSSYTRSKTFLRVCCLRNPIIPKRSSGLFSVYFVFLPFLSEVPISPESSARVKKLISSFPW